MTLLLGWRTLGPFLAFQYAIDLNYTALMSHAEHAFVVAGPGARDGMWKCFDSLGDYTLADTIVWLTERQEEEFERYGLRSMASGADRCNRSTCRTCSARFRSTLGSPIRTIEGRSGRVLASSSDSRRPASRPRPFFPPKWGLNSAHRRVVPRRSARYEPHGAADRLGRSSCRLTTARRRVAEICG